MFKQMGLARSALRELEAAVAADPNNGDAHWGLMLYLLKAPGIAGGDKKKARGEAAAVAKIDNARGLLAQAIIAEHEKQMATAEEFFRKARDATKDAENVEPFCDFLVKQKRWDEAEKCSADLIKLAPDRITGYTQLAMIHASQGHWNELDRVMSSVDANVGDNLNPYFQAARILIGSGADNNRAERYLRKYLSQEPELDAPKLSRAHWRLGQILEKEGRKSEAITEMETATRMEPEFKPARADLERIR